MTERSLLALTKVDEFADWAVAQGYQREATKGMYEILRLRFRGAGSPLLFFRKDRTLSGGDPVHATCQGDATKLVRQWLSAAAKEATR